MKEVVCPACKEPVGEEPVCPSCLATTTPRTNLFTYDKPVVARDQQAAPQLVADSKQDSFLAVTFKPSSAFKRVFIKARGPLSTGLATLVFAAAGFQVWSTHYTDLALGSDQRAAAHYRSEEYEKAVHQWQKAQKYYRWAFDSEGQVRMLRQIGDCYFLQGEYEQALAVLRRAATHEETEDLLEAIHNCYRKLAYTSLQTALQDLKAERYRGAIAVAEQAQKSFEEGNGTPAERAKCQRVVALSFAGLENFSSAESHLQKAFNLEGQSPGNLAARKRLQKLARISQNLKLRAARQRALGTSKPIPQAKATRPKARHYSSRPTTTRPRVSVSTQSSYPTYRKPEPTEYPTSTTNYNPRPYTPQTNLRTRATVSRPSYPTSSHTNRHPSAFNANTKSSTARTQSRFPGSSSGSPTFNAPTFDPPTFNSPNKSY
jgi:tetratricopeptide (TPR) repeat protein